MRIAKWKLKKQSQFFEGRNERNASYNKGIREIYRFGHLVKTNPIQSQSRLAPRPVLGVEKLFEKTKPISRPCFAVEAVGLSFSKTG